MPPTTRNRRMRACFRRVMLATTALAALLATPAHALLTGPEPIKDVPYGALETENGTVFPAPVRGDETVAFVHGGWCSAQLGEGEELTNHISPTIDRKVMLQLQRGLGSLVFDIDYPQMTRSQSAYPMEPRAIERAVVWLHEHAAEYGGDPDNIVMWGSSCGGWVAAEASEFLQEDHPGMLSAAIEWSAPWLDVPEFMSELINGETAASGVGPTVEMLECHAFVSKATRTAKNRRRSNARRSSTSARASPG